MDLTTARYVLEIESRHLATAATTLAVGYALQKKAGRMKGV